MPQDGHLTKEFGAVALIIAIFTLLLWIAMTAYPHAESIEPVYRISLALLKGVLIAFLLVLFLEGLPAKRQGS